MTSDLTLPRRSKQQTRRLLLLAGTLVADATVASDDDQHLARWLAHVRLERVLPVAKQLQLFLRDRELELGGAEPSMAWLHEHRDEILSVDASEYRDIAKPLAYTVFDHENDFRANLATALLSRERITDVDRLEEAFERLREENRGELPGLTTLLCELADVEFRRVRSLEATFVELGAAPFARHPVIQRLLRETWEGVAHAEGGLIPFYEMIMEAYGWRMRPGFTTLDLYTALSSMVYGMAFHHRIWPETVRDDIETDRGRRSLFAVTVEAIVREMAEGPD